MQIPMTNPRRPMHSTPRVRHMVAAFAATALLITVMTACAADQASGPTSGAIMSPPPPTPGAIMLSPPLGDCYGGALLQEPMHCYILESAEARGLIDVEGIYDAEGRLYIYTGQTGTFGAQTGEGLKQAATKFYDEWWRLAPRGPAYDSCRGDGDDRWCLLGDSWFRQGDIVMYLPFPAEYSVAEMWAGGAKSRLRRRGWASWDQLWPPVAHKSLPVFTYSGKFDVSLVQLTDLPADHEFNCTTWSSKICGGWERFSDSGIVDWHVGVPLDDDSNSKIFLQVKLPPKDPEQLEYIKERLPIGELAGLEVVEVPVKYDFGEMARWGVILNRFAESPGNTIGITAAMMRKNRVSGRRDVVWPTERVGPDRSGRPWDFPSETYLTILALFAYQPQVVSDALPVLLPQLGIPTDAVGLIIADDPRPPRRSFALNLSDREEEQAKEDQGKQIPLRSDAAQGSSVIPDGRDKQAVSRPEKPSEALDERGAPTPAAGVARTDRVGANSGTSKWVIAGGSGGIAAILLGGVIVLAMRSRRERA